MNSLPSFFDLIPRSNLVKNSFVADVWDLKGIPANAFSEGRSFQKWPAGIRFSASKRRMDGDLDDFVINNAMVPLITPRLAKLLGRLRLPRFELLPASAVQSTGDTAPVFILNMLQHVQGLDLEETKAVRYDDDFPNASLRGKLCTLIEPTLVWSSVKKWDLFRCKEFPDRLFASEQFRLEFADSNFTGVLFSRVRLSKTS